MLFYQQNTNKNLMFQPQNVLNFRLRSLIMIFYRLPQVSGQYIMYKALAVITTVTNTMTFYRQNT